MEKLDFLIKISVKTLVRYIFLRLDLLISVHQELSSEKSKVTSVETRLSSQLSKREQEMMALQARMQASYQDHVAQTQRLNAKVTFFLLLDN